MVAPATDVSTQAFFWSSFNISPRRVQDGGWARELTQSDFAISDEIAGVNMYLEAGGIRELHWHQTAEWALMTRGRCRDHHAEPAGAAERRGRRGGRPLVLPRRACPTRCRASARTVPSSCSPSTTASSRRATPCCSPTGSRTRRPRCWPRTSASRRRSSRTSRCTTSGSSPATCPATSRPTRPPPAWSRATSP